MIARALNRTFGNEKRKNRKTFQRTLKTVMDRLGALVLLIVLSPIFLLMIVMMKLEGHEGSIFYDGRRVGRDGRMFKCWKFRTMKPDSDHLLHAYLDAHPEWKAHWDKYLKLDHDPRVVTRIARFMRKTSLDELPQLYNVLRGDMSLVGPRPILPDEKDRFGGAYETYCSVKPGMTGLWQVSGRNNVTFDERVGMDQTYVQNWSLFRDIMILFKTAHVVVSRAGAH